jgi:hypothetical protein
MNMKIHILSKTTNTTYFASLIYLNQKVVVKVPSSTPSKEEVLFACRKEVNFIKYVKKTKGQYIYCVGISKRATKRGESKRIDQVETKIILSKIDHEQIAALYHGDYDEFAYDDNGLKILDILEKSIKRTEVKEAMNVAFSPKD